MLLDIVEERQICHTRIPIGWISLRQLRESISLQCKIRRILVQSIYHVLVLTFFYFRQHKFTPHINSVRKRRIAIAMQLSLPPPVYLLFNCTQIKIQEMELLLIFNVCLNTIFYNYWTDDRNCWNLSLDRF